MRRSNRTELCDATRNKKQSRSAETHLGSDATQTLIRAISKEDTIASAAIALVCGLNFWVGCQDRLRVNSDADEALA